jgi:glucose-6-phosphate 1-dehydrogenase
MKTKLIIFGITGDLAARKLLPAVSRIVGTGEFDDLAIIGVSRRHVEQDEVLGDHLEQLGGTTSMFTMDLSNPEDYVKLREYINLQDGEQALFYLAVPPASSTEIVEYLGQARLNTPNCKLLLEKPFGIDLESSKDMISHVATYFTEEHVYRIDHYLAKAMALNIVIFRSSNAIFNSIWDNRFIESIEVVASEEISIEGRAHFYEQTGALRDFVQGHLMQLLALILLHVPEDLDWDKLPAARSEALKQVQPADPAQSVRAQYVGYRDEVKNPDSQVETFVSTTLTSNDPNWKGVPLHLTTGKSLNKKSTEVRVHFRQANATQSNCLIFHIQPNEGIEIDLITKKPGYDQDFETQKLHFMYPEGTELPDAYEQVIVDAIRSHKSLFTTGDEVIRAWEILAPLQQAWAAGQSELKMYPAGSTVEDILSQ